VKTACGIDDDGVGVTRFGGCNRVVDYGGRICAGFLLDDLDAVALRPDFELLDGGGAERVRSAKNDAAALLLQAIRQLADAGGLACAVDANDENHPRTIAVRGSRKIRYTRGC
jgi:hypothetical protein